MAEFQYPNCSGEVTYRPMNRNWGVCYQGDITNITDYGMFDWSFASEDCDLSVSGVSYNFQFNKWGACQTGMNTRRSTLNGKLIQRGEFSAMYTSYMYLANINDSYVSPQTFDNQPIQAFSENNAYCPSTDNCTLANGQPAQMWTTYFNEYQCQGGNYSYFNLDAAPGTCTNYYNSSYAKIGCYNEHTTVAIFYSDASCTQPFFVFGSSTQCSLTSTSTTHCTATPMTLPDFVPSSSPQTPESDAPILSYSSLLVAVTALMTFLAC
jgi:hypothetical protein